MTWPSPCSEVHYTGNFDGQDLFGVCLSEIVIRKY